MRGLLETMKLSKRQKIVILVIAIVVLVGVGAFLVGMQYQKIQPVKVELTSYSGDTIIQTQMYSMRSEKDWLGLSTNSTYVRSYNVTEYGILIHNS